LKFQNQGFDSVEFVVRDLSTHTPMYERMGFEKIGERVAGGMKSILFAQGRVRVMLSTPQNDQGKNSHAGQFLESHGEGICVLAVDVENSEKAFLESVKRGAKPAMEPKKSETAEGRVIRSEIWTLGNIRYAFMERGGNRGENAPALFDDGMVAFRLESPSPFGIRTIDHLTNNVSIGQMKEWVRWYKEIFDFTVTRHFDIRTGRTGLISDVVESKDGKIKVPVNEATEPESQVQEFVDRMKGPGVQHLALLTTDIIQTLKELRKAQYKFLSVPHTYYEEVPARVPGVKEDLGTLEDLGILLDGDKSGYLMQIFSEEMVGPFFFEYIERKGNKGFGEGNFRALFEAIERDQIRRGVLKH
jgi:4-hydroxyphenylpyruvate dioxygenase